MTYLVLGKNQPGYFKYLISRMASQGMTPDVQKVTVLLIPIIPGVIEKESRYIVSYITNNLSVGLGSFIINYSNLSDIIKNYSRLTDGYDLSKFIYYRGIFKVYVDNVEVAEIKNVQDYDEVKKKYTHGFTKRMDKYPLLIKDKSFTICMFCAICTVDTINFKFANFGRIKQIGSPDLLYPNDFPFKPLDRYINMQLAQLEPILNNILINKLNPEFIRSNTTKAYQVYGFNIAVNNCGVVKLINIDDYPDTPFDRPGYDEMRAHWEWENILYPLIQTTRKW